MILYSKGSNKCNKIALTFDDGPNPYWTPKILDIFEKFNIKGNFFVLGKWVEAYPNVLRDAFDRGHLIGNHTYSHLKDGVEDFAKAEEVIHKVISTHTRFFRFPYLNKVPVSFAPIERNEVFGVDGEVASGDWEKKSDEILDIVIKNTTNGSIIILHDGSEKESELENRPIEMFNVLPQIIEILMKRFQIVRLDEMELS